MYHCKLMKGIDVRVSAEVRNLVMKKATATMHIEVNLHILDLC